MLHMKQVWSKSKSSLDLYRSNECHGGGCTLDRIQGDQSSILRMLAAQISGTEKNKVIIQLRNTYGKMDSINQQKYNPWLF